jgi:hypothetical protein
MEGAFFSYWPKGRKTTKNRKYEEIKRKKIKNECSIENGSESDWKSYAYSYFIYARTTK